MGVLDSNQGLGVDNEGQKLGESVHLGGSNVQPNRNCWQCVGSSSDMGSRCNSISINGIVLNCRGKPDVVADPWQLCLDESTNALNVAWIKVPGAASNQLLIIAGSAQWLASRRTQPGLEL